MKLGNSKISDNKHLRVALLMTDLGLGGAQLQSIHIARALKALDVNFRVYYTNYGERFEEIRALNVPVISFGESKNPLLRVWALTRLLREYKPHLVFSLRTYANIYASLSASLVGTRSLGSIRSTIPYEIETNGRFMMYWMCRLPTAVAANSHSARVGLKQLGWINPERIIELTNVIDLGVLDAIEAETPAPRDRIVFVGRLLPVKRPDLLIQTLEKVRVECPDARLLIIGDGKLRAETEALVAEMALDGHVEFAGYRADVMRQLKTHGAMLLMTSDYEGLANVQLEAMAASLPIVTTRAGDSEIVVQHGETGFVADVGDSDSLAAYTIRLLKNSTLRKQMGAAGRSRVETYYSYDNLPHRLQQIFAQVMSG